MGAVSRRRNFNSGLPFPRLAPSSRMRAMICAALSPKIHLPAPALFGAMVRRSSCARFEISMTVAGPGRPAPDRDRGSFVRIHGKILPFRAPPPVRASQAGFKHQRAKRKIDPPPARRVFAGLETIAQPPAFQGGVPDLVEIGRIERTAAHASCSESALPPWLRPVRRASPRRLPLRTVRPIRPHGASPKWRFLCVVYHPHTATLGTMFQIVRNRFGTGRPVLRVVFYAPADERVSQRDR